MSHKMMQHPALSTPLRMGELNLKNRVIMSGMTRARCPNKVPTGNVAEYYRQRAGAGLLVSEATCVNELGYGWADSPAIHTDEQVEGWRMVTRAVHEAGGLIVCQIWHQGRTSHSSFLPEGQQIFAPSAIPCEGLGYGADLKKYPMEVPRPLETEEVEATVEDFGLAARRAREAGFDGVEIHAASGHLIDQFLQSCSNQRDDKYGGSIENRFTFLKEVVERVLQEFPAGRVGVKIAPNLSVCNMGSEDNHEMFLHVASGLCPYDLAYVMLVDGTNGLRMFHGKCKPVSLTDIRPLLSDKTCLIGNCGYTGETASACIKAGEADAIAFGRAFLVNPDLAERLINGWPLEQTPAEDYQWQCTPVPEVRANPSRLYTDFPAYQQIQMEVKTR
jgi:2,4-dienoyl-CoA reductase-like NADH-dependent reductase (Old Yellow Enzyme family)